MKRVFGARLGGVSSSFSGWPHKQAFPGVLDMSVTLEYHYRRATVKQKREHRLKNAELKFLHQKPASG